MPVIAEHAEELTVVFGDERLYAFRASQPTTTEELRDQFARLAANRLADKKGTAAQLDGAPPRRWPGGGHAAGGLLRSGPRRRDRLGGGRGLAEPSIASEASRAVVDWLERRGVVTITAHIHPDHHVARPGQAYSPPAISTTRAFVSSCGAGGSSDHWFR